MINFTNTFAAHYFVSPDTQPLEQAKSRQKRSPGDAEHCNSAPDDAFRADRGRRRNGGGLDSLGQGRLL